MGWHLNDCCGFGFNTQPPEGGCISINRPLFYFLEFQHTAARRRLQYCCPLPVTRVVFQHTAARRRLRGQRRVVGQMFRVSTHSRPKAAARICNTFGNEWRFQHTAARRRLLLAWSGVNSPLMFQHTAARRRLLVGILAYLGYFQFQHTAARRRLLFALLIQQTYTAVSTHSRPKAAASPHPQKSPPPQVSTHSRPKAAAKFIRLEVAHYNVSTHSRPKAAANLHRVNTMQYPCFNTQPPEGGCVGTYQFVAQWGGFNTQPPEGGCLTPILANLKSSVSTHSRPKAAAFIGQPFRFFRLFQHTAARRRLQPRPQPASAKAFTPLFR